MEVLPDSNPDHLQTPEAVLMRPSLLAIFDTLKDELYLTAPVYVRTGVTARQAYEAAEARIDDAVQRLSQAMPITPPPADLPSIAIQSNTTRDDYFAMVARAKDYITAGDIFHHQALPERGRDMLAEYPGQSVSRASRRERHHEFDALARIAILRVSAARHQNYGEARRDHLSFHEALPPGFTCGRAFSCAPASMCTSISSNRNERDFPLALG